MTLRSARGGVELTVRVQPRASRSEIHGLHGDALKVRIAAPPVEGAANEALVKLLAKSLGVPRSDVTVIRGHRSRDKVVRVEGIELEEARRRLSL